MIERKQLAPLSDFAWEEPKDRASSDVFEAQIAILHNFEDDDLAEYGFGIKGGPNEKMHQHGFAQGPSRQKQISA